MFASERIPIIKPMIADINPMAVSKWLKYAEIADQLDASIPVIGWVKWLSITQGRFVAQV